ncbi:MAG: hypothetical protein LUE14_02970 [Clostridiales bacterium]|nr:hypothetical protein [Clostridiales bacterium]
MDALITENLEHYTAGIVAAFGNVPDTAGQCEGADVLADVARMVAGIIGPDGDIS